MSAAGRIETYLHSDAATQNKGGALVKVSSTTDFAAKTAAFQAFARKAARMAYAAGAAAWPDVAAAFPEVEREREALALELREQVVVSEIAVFKL